MIGRLGVFSDSQHIGKRLKQIRSDLGLSQSKLSSDIGIGQHNLSRYESGQVDLPIHAMSAIYILGYNLNWLICGKGSMKIKDNEDTESNLLLLENENKKLKDRIQKIEKEKAELSKELIQRLGEIVDLHKRLNNDKKE